MTVFPIVLFSISSFRSCVAGAACLLLTATASLPGSTVAQPAGAVAAPRASAASSAPEPVAVPPVQPGFPASPPLAARSFLLIDVGANNQILAAKDMDADGTGLADQADDGLHRV